MKHTELPAIVEEGVRSSHSSCSEFVFLLFLGNIHKEAKAKVHQLPYVLGLYCGRVMFKCSKYMRHWAPIIGPDFRARSIFDLVFWNKDNGHSSHGEL